MPYRRRYVKRGGKKKRAYVPKKVTDKYIARVAKKALRVRQEEKWIEVFQTVKAPKCGFGDPFFGPLAGNDINQNLFRLNNVNAGSSYQTREGLEIEAVKLQLNMRSYYSQTPSLTSGMQYSYSKRFRVIVFWYDQQDSDTLVEVDYPQKQEMFLQNTNTLLPVSQVDLMYNPIHKNRFKILMDRIYMVGNQSNSLVHTLHKTLYLKNRRVKYPKDIIANNNGFHYGLFLLILSDNPAGTGLDSTDIVKHEISYNFFFRDI